MKHFLKGVAVIAAVTIINMVVHIVCNTHGIHLDSTVTGTVSAVCTMLVYHGWVSKENDKESER